MANKKVSQLSATTEANDGVWLIMNNSGNTETFRIKREDLLSGTSTPAGFIQGDASQSLVPYYFPTSSGTTSATTYVDNFNVGNRLTNGTHAGLNSPDSITWGDNNNQVRSDNTNQVVIGKSITNNGRGSASDAANLLLGQNYTFTGYHSIIMNAYGSNTNAEYCLVVAGNGQTTGKFNTLISSANQKILSGQYNLKGGGYGGTSNNTNASIIWGEAIENDNGDRNFIFGGGKNNNYNYSNYADDSSIIGGNGNRLEGTSGNEISQSSIIGGSGNTISANTENAILLGLTDYTASTNNTTYVDNIHTLRTETFDVFDAGNVGGTGATNVDLSLATLYKFSMTADTSPNFINWREGQRITFVVENTSTYSVPTMTISGGGSVLVKGGAVNPTNNGITKYTGVIISGDLYLNEELDFQAL